jgi:hypothetical protein
LSFLHAPNISAMVMIVMPLIKLVFFIVGVLFNVIRLLHLTRLPVNLFYFF